MSPSVPARTLVDAAGLPLKTTANGDGTSSLTPVAGTSSAVITYAAAAQAPTMTPISFSTAALRELAVDITVTSFAGGTAPTITFFVERFGADGVWYRVWTSSAVNAAGVVSTSIGPGAATPASLSGTCRFGWTTTGTPTSVTFSASVIGK